jgi:zinc transporter ZupT
MTDSLLTGLSAPVLLGLSVVVLVLGPLSLARLERSRVALQLMDGFVLVSVAGLVLADVLPHALRQGGWVVVPLVLIGLIGPSMLEGRLGHAARRVHLATLFVGVAGLVLHAGIDGVALSSVGSEGVSGNIAVAVLLHRLPEGLTIWWLLRPSHGRWVAMGTLGLVAMSTAVGMTIGQATEFLHQTSGLAYIGALVGGSLLHVVVHRSHPMVHAAPFGRWHLASGMGALAGAGLLTVLKSAQRSNTCMKSAAWRCSGTSPASLPRRCCWPMRRRVWCRSRCRRPRSRGCGAAGRSARRCAA